MIMVLYSTVFRNLACVWLAELVMCTNTNNQVENGRNKLQYLVEKPERTSLIRSLRTCAHPQIPVQ